MLKKELENLVEDLYATIDKSQQENVKLSRELKEEKRSTERKLKRIKEELLRCGINTKTNEENGKLEISFNQNATINEYSPLYWLIFLTKEYIEEYGIGGYYYNV